MILEVGKAYKILSIEQHTNCQGCDKCTVLTLMEKDFMPGEIVEVHNRLGDNILIQIGTGRFAVKESHLDCCTFEELE